MLTFFRRLMAFFRRDGMAADLEEEMRLHLELRAAELERQGMRRADAMDAARRRFGNVTVMQETSTDMWGGAPFDRLRQDLRFAMRRIRQNPGFSVPVIVVLALGIGATTAVFSAIDAAFLRPLPFARPGELVILPHVDVPFREEGERGGPLVDIRDVREMRSLFANASAFAPGALNLADPENPVRVNAGVVTTDFFATLGVRPRAGRDFVPEEGVPGGAKVVILSDAFWRRQFGAREMVGTAITLQNRPYTVIGVTPPGFSFPNESDLWIPMSVPTTAETFEPFRGWLPDQVVARLAPGVTAEAANARLLAVWEGRVRAHAVPGRRSNAAVYLEKNLRVTGAVRPLQTHLVGNRRQALATVMGATMLLLLIACANVANLMLSDAARREREVAVRQVLGATRGRIVRQLLGESVLLSLAGAILGLALAPIALSVLRAMLPADLAGVAPAQLDLRVLAFATLLALATAIAFGLWPALGASRTDASGTIKSGGGHGATSRSGGIRRMLVGAELALTVVLLVGAGLMIRSFERLVSQEYGMRPDQVATLEMSFARSSQGPAERSRVVNAVLDRLEQRPGIEAIGAVNDLPLRGTGGLSVTIDVPDAPESLRGQFARYLMASGGYFQALGIPLLYGRTFTAADDSLAPRVAIVSASMARKYWPDRSALNRVIKFPGDSVPYTVVGVVADVREYQPDEDPGEQMYFPIDRQSPSNVAIVARSSLRPATLLTEMREAVRAADPRQAVYNVRMMSDVMDTAIAPRRTDTLLIAIFAGLALVLAVLGVYAVVAYSVAQRRRELGIRTALGASARDLLGLVSREMALVAVVGIALGLGVAWTLARVIASLLYGVDTHDAATFATVPAVLLLPAAVATMIPAIRATRVDPAEVMRAD